MTGGAPDVTAVRLPLDPGPAIDPFALAGPDGIVFCSGPRIRVGLGAALTIDLPRGLNAPDDLREAAGALAAIAAEDHVAHHGGSGPADRSGPGSSAVVAFGAFPFDRSAGAALVVPEVLYGSDGGGEEWITVVGADHRGIPSGPTGLRSWVLRRSRNGGDPDRSGSQDRASGPPPPPRIVPRSSDAGFRTMVAEALGAIDRGDMAKVVLSRQVDVTMGHAIVVADLLRRWHHLEPNCTVFSVPTPDGQFVGASPELLVERTGLRFRSRPLAGTTRRSVSDSGGATHGALLESSKDGNEHRLVVEEIDRALRPICTRLSVPDHPDLVHLHTITHLGTAITGTLAQEANGTAPTVLDLVSVLHPTPAVGGVPARTALPLIERLEPHARGRFAGPVGYVDGRGDGTWMLGIRSMSVRGAFARLTAGVGIVEGSDPESELIETDLKLSAVFDALAPGLPFSTGHASARREAVS
jgi:menaquinone-specific isochorismate synthase